MFIIMFLYPMSSGCCVVEKERERENIEEEKSLLFNFKGEVYCHLDFNS
jgi:hypothetical protein